LSDKFRVACCAVLLLITSHPALSQIRQDSLQPGCDALSPDQDDDGLSDACELQIARRFAPLLVVAPGGCNWDESVTPARLGGAYLFGVERVNERLRIAYLPAYYRDCGWHGMKCRLPYVDCSPHNGDSEFVVVEVTEQNNAWSPRQVFLSAHCFGKHAQDCRWYAADNFIWMADAPVIWVAEGRQANYPSKRSCDRGIHSIDTCDRNTLRYRYPILSDIPERGQHEKALIRPWMSAWWRHLEQP
jgi:hypothetical protein